MGSATSSLNRDMNTGIALLGLILHDPLMRQELLFPDPHPHKMEADKISLEDYTEWNRDNHTMHPWGQYPGLCWNTCINSRGRAVGKSEQEEARNEILEGCIRKRCPITFVLLEKDAVRKFWDDKFKPILEHHPILKNFVHEKRDGDTSVRFKTESDIKIDYTGQKVKGKDTARRQMGRRSVRLLTDEAQLLAQEQVAEATHQFQVDPTDPEHTDKYGAAFKIYGVSDGSRDSALYYYDNENPLSKAPVFRGIKEINGRDVMINRRWKLPKPGVPWYTRGMHDKDLTNNKCKPDQDFYSDKYRRDVWARHGKEKEQHFSWSIRGPISEGVKDYVHLVIPKMEFEDCVIRKDGKIVDWHLGRFDTRMPPAVHGVHGVGIDVGTSIHYEGVTAMAGFYAEMARTDKWYMQWMVELPGWENATDQAFILDWLHTRYNFSFIGIDKMSDGHGLVDPLKTLPNFQGDYNTIIHPFAFNQKITVGFHRDIGGEIRAITPLQTQAAMEREVEIKARVDQWSMQEIRDWMVDRRLLLPSQDQDPSLHIELESITREVARMSDGTSGWHYEPDHPHYCSSIQMFIAAHLEWDHLVNKPKPDSFGYEDDGTDAIWMPVGDTLFDF